MLRWLSGSIGRSISNREEMFQHGEWLNGIVKKYWCKKWYCVSTLMRRLDNKTKNGIKQFMYRWALFDCTFSNEAWSWPKWTVNSIIFVIQLCKIPTGRFHLFPLMYMNGWIFQWQNHLIESIHPKSVLPSVHKFRVYYSWGTISKPIDAKKINSF
jgi:hypothetical protein